MIIWEGLGYLVAVIVFCFSLVANFIFNATYGDGYYDHHKWPVALSLVFSAFACSILGNLLRKRSDRVMIDKLTGKEVVINQTRNTLFFIPVHYWGMILFVIALVCFFLEFKR